MIYDGNRNIGRGPKFKLMIRLCENLLILPSPEMLNIIKMSVTKAAKGNAVIIDKVYLWLGICPAFNRPLIPGERKARLRLSFPFSLWGKKCDLLYLQTDRHAPSNLPFRYSDDQVYPGQVYIWSSFVLINFYLGQVYTASPPHFWRGLCTELWTHWYWLNHP